MALAFVMINTMTIWQIWNANPVTILGFKLEIYIKLYSQTCSAGNFMSCLSCNTTALRSLNNIY